MGRRTGAHALADTGPARRPRAAAVRRAGAAGPLPRAGRGRVGTGNRAAARRVLGAVPASTDRAGRGRRGGGRSRSAAAGRSGGPPVGPAGRRRARRRAGRRGAKWAGPGGGGGGARALPVAAADARSGACRATGWPGDCGAGGPATARGRSARAGRAERQDIRLAARPGGRRGSGRAGRRARTRCDGSPPRSVSDLGGRGAAAAYGRQRPGHAGGRRGSRCLRRNRCRGAARCRLLAGGSRRPRQRDGPGEALAALPAPVLRELLRWRPPRSERGLTVFFTGLPGSGKSTLARALVDLLLEDGRRRVTVLDGDVVRRMLSAGLGFSRTDRDLNVRRIGWIAAEVGRHGGIAVCAPIAPYAATRAAVRRDVEAAGGDFVLVHVATPLEVCERRDPKGLYAKARAGLVPHFTGVSDAYEEPVDADLVLDTSRLTTADAVQRIVALLTDGRWLPPT